jgi:hypothetical protein
MPNQIAYGFHSHLDIFSRRVVDGNVDIVRNAIIATAAEYTRQSNALDSALVERTTRHKEAYADAAVSTLEPIDEWTSPAPILVTGKFDTAYPIKGGGTAFGTNRISRAKMTVEQANDLTLTHIKADADWRMRHIISALLTKESWTFQDKQYGDLTIKGLASGDTDKYEMKNGSTSTDDHYFAQSAAISDGANPFKTLVDELVEHPANTGPRVFYVSQSLESAIRGLTEFQRLNDPNVDLGANGVTLTSDFSNALAFGDEVIGYLKNAGAAVVRWDRLPAGYGFGVTLSAPKPIKMREHEEAELQGFFPELHNVDGNLEVNRMLRFCGYGAANRVGAIAFQIGAASYTTPAVFKAPMPR